MKKNQPRKNWTLNHMWYKHLWRCYWSASHLVENLLDLHDARFGSFGFVGKGTPSHCNIYLQSRQQVVQPLRSRPSVQSNCYFFYIFQLLFVLFAKLWQPYCDCRIAVHSEWYPGTSLLAYYVSCKDLLDYSCLGVDTFLQPHSVHQGFCLVDGQLGLCCWHFVQKYFIALFSLWTC